MQEQEEEININIKAFFQILWREKVVVTSLTLLAIVLGGFYAFSLKEEFISEGKILPELQTKAGGASQLSGLAALAGVDLSAMSAGGGADAINPSLYPDVLRSTPFFLELFNHKVNTKDKKTLAFSDFYNQQVLDNDIEAKNLKLNFPLSNDYIAVNYQTEKNIIDLKKRLTSVLDKKTGVITISAKFPDPVVAAEIARYSMNYLAEYVINYRTAKSQKDLQFLEDRLNAAKGKFYSNQVKKANYSDEMPLKSLRLQSADLQRERIESEYKVSSSFYNSLLNKYEEAKLKIQQETPVLKILEPPVVPNLKSEPKKSIILIGAAILGALVGVIVAMLRKKNYKEVF